VWASRGSEPPLMPTKTRGDKFTFVEAGAVALQRCDEQLFGNRDTRHVRLDVLELVLCHRAPPLLTGSLAGRLADFGNREARLL
jgi:hypothetical protein